MTKTPILIEKRRRMDTKKEEEQNKEIKEQERKERKERKENNNALLSHLKAPKECNEGAKKVPCGRVKLL